MGRFAELADERRRIGEQQRSTYQPKATGVPLRVFRWWQRQHDDSYPVPKNFCHYWRVVFIWSWVLLLKKIFLNKYTLWLALLAIVALTIIAPFSMTNSFWGGMLILGGAAIFVTSIFAAMIIGNACMEGYEQSDLKDEPWPAWLFVLVGLPGTLLALIVAGIVWPLRFVPWSSIWDTLAHRDIIFGRYSIVGTLLRCAAAALVIFCFWSGAWWMGLIFILAQVTFWFEPFASQRMSRREEEQKTRERLEMEEFYARLDPLFRAFYRFSHSDEDFVEESYQEWLRSYLARAESLGFVSREDWIDCLVTDEMLPLQWQVTNSSNIDKMPEIDAEIRAFRAQLEEEKRTIETAEQRRFDYRVFRALLAVGEFIYLIYQAVRVTKWRICPKVRID
jgi:multisubunit Na+/H+ antiporter MnhG subunit